MSRFERHDRIIMARRKRQRAHDNRPRPWLRLGQVLLVAVAAVTLLAVGITGAGVALGLGVYNSYAAQLPDASIIEAQSSPRHPGQRGARRPHAGVRMSRRCLPIV